MFAVEGTRMRDRQQVNIGKDQHHTHTHSSRIYYIRYIEAFSAVCFSKLFFGDKTRILIDVSHFGGCQI